MIFEIKTDLDGKNSHYDSWRQFIAFQSITYCSLSKCQSVKNEKCSMKTG